MIIFFLNMFYHENFCANLWVVSYSCYIPQFIFVCYLIILQENLSCAIVLSSCIELLFCVLPDIYLAQPFCVRGQKHSFFTSDDWKVIIWKDEYKKVPIWNGLLGFKVWNPQLFLVASKHYKSLLLRCKSAAQKIVMYLEGTLLSSTTFPPQSPCKISLAPVGVSFILFFHDTCDIWRAFARNCEKKWKTKICCCWCFMLVNAPGSEVFLK